MASFGGAVEASCDLVWLVLLWRGMFRYGSRGTVWFIWAGRVSAGRVMSMQGMSRQSCLGTVRRGAVMFGEVRQSRRGGAGLVMASLVKTRLGEAVEARSEVARHGLVWIGSHGMGNHQLSERRQYASIYQQIFISQRL